MNSLVYSPSMCSFSFIAVLVFLNSFAHFLLAEAEFIEVVFLVKWILLGALSLSGVICDLSF